METPDIRTAWSGDFAIAYQIFGKGSTDVLYLRTRGGT